VLFASGPAHAFAGELDAVGVVDEPVQNGVSIGRIADYFVPSVDWKLGGNHRGAASVALLEPLFKGGLTGITPGSSCIANAYSNNHDVIASKETGVLKGVALHAVDALGLVHALILRLQALVLPFQTLVFSGH